MSKRVLQNALIGFIAMLSGCASAPGARLPAAAAAAVEQTHEGMVTGSRVRQPLGRDPRNPETAYPVQVVTSEQMQATGRFTTAEALRALVPSLH